MRDLALFFAALSDSTRLRLLHLMKDGEICVCFLQGVLRSNQPKISRHLAYLRRSCWVDIRREGVWMYYSLNRESCTICKELLQTLKLHASNLPEAASDRDTLAAFQHTKDNPACH